MKALQDLEDQINVKSNDLLEKLERGIKAKRQEILEDLVNQTKDKREVELQKLVKQAKTGIEECFQWVVDAKNSSTRRDVQKLVVAVLGKKHLNKFIRGIYRKG